MEGRNNNNALKIIIAILALALIGSFAYIWKTKNETQIAINDLTSQREELKSELKNKIAEYDAMIMENSVLKDELLEERNKMANLLVQVEKLKDDKDALARYKSEYNRLKREMDNLIAENKLLKEQNVALTSSLDSTQTELASTKKFNDTLISQNENLAKRVEKGSKLSVLNLQVLAINDRWLGSAKETDKAAKADKLKISFLIAENQIAQQGDRLYYVQIINSKNNVLGEKKTINIEENSLTYSFAKNITYKNKTVQVNEELSGKDFEKGTYFVHVFDKNGTLVSKTDFNLK